MPRIMDWYSVWERLKRAGYQQLFEFQEKAVAAFIKGQDVLVKALTGAGKTLIPIICATNKEDIDIAYSSPSNFIKSPPHNR